MQASLRLLGRRRFLPLFATQFLGAFNDNLFRNAMIILVIFKIYEDPEREAVFRRFRSIRPDGEAFGRHSGLGLAIARTVVDGHQGAISVEGRGDGRPGARFVVRLPLAEPA